MSNLFDISSLAMIPTAYKDGKLYSVRPIPEYGSEKIINGSFDADTAWTKGTGWTISGGTASCDGTQTSTTNLNNTAGNGLVNGKTYRVVYTISGYAGGSIRIKLGNTGYGVYHSANGTYTQDLVAGVTTFPTAQFNADANFVGSIDNVSVQEITKSGDFTFSRGSNLAATRVASSGYIEKGRENVLLQSNQFDTTWSTFSASVTSGQADKDGGTDAWLLQNTASSISFISQSIVQSGVQTFSIYAKGGNVDWMRVNAIVSGSNANAYFDITNGTIGSSSGAEIDKTITSAGNGFYRITLSFNDTISQIRVQIADGDGDENTALGSNIYIQDSQLEAGLVATDYIETTTTSVSAGILEDMPRLDYSGGASCPSLLLEPQRSNLVDDYSGYTWNAFNGAAISFTGTQQSPEGLNNAVTWTFGGTSGEVVQRSSISISNTTAYTISGYFKLTSGTLTSGSNQLKGLDGLSGGSVSLNTLTSEWQRLSFSVTSSSTSGRVQLRCDNSATIQVYGLQLEAGSYETSIIPTYGSSVTRSLDSMNDYNFTASSVLTIAGEYKLNQNTHAGGGAEVILEYSNSADYRIYFESQSGANRVRFRTENPIQEFSKILSDTAGVDYVKYALVVNNTSVKGFVNGVLVWDTSVTTQVVDDLKYRMQNTAYSTKQILLFPTALTDSECIALTTL